MRCSFSLFLLLGAAACHTSASTEVCHPVSSWVSPVVACADPSGTALASAAPPPEESTEPVAGEPTSAESAPVAPVEAVSEPKATLAKDTIEVSGTIEFEVGSQRLASQSTAILDDVAAILRNNPNISKVQVEGHTDSKASRAVNQRLSTSRAKAVRKYLIGKGISAHRLVAKGFGSRSPIADNATEEGRRKNRRVVFKILKRR